MELLNKLLLAFILVGLNTNIFLLLDVKRNIKIDRKGISLLLLVMLSTGFIVYLQGNELYRTAFQTSFALFFDRNFRVWLSH